MWARLQYQGLQGLAFPMDVPIGKGCCQTHPPPSVAAFMLGITSHMKGTLVLFDSLASSEKERNQKAEQGSLQTDKMGTKC